MNTETDRPGGAVRRAQPLLMAAAVYFCMVFFVGALLGPLRVLWLEPFAGPTLAVLVEAPLLILAMSFAASWAPAWARFEGGSLSFLAMGILALVLQQVADLAVGFGLRGMTFDSQIRYFATPPGWIYALCLVVFALMPMLAHWRRRARARRAQPEPPRGGTAP
ncbi:MAG: hypothetical protein JSS00_11170 [Proteobacteria bacterium]|nr:hypothetical protein [Pseudomonadota bacterium]